MISPIKMLVQAIQPFRSAIAAATLGCVSLVCHAEPAAIALNPQFGTTLLAALNATRIVGQSTKPMASFQWTIEYTRPLRKVRVSRESYYPLALKGLAQSRVETLNEPDDKPAVVAPKPSYSVRGLERIQEADTQLSFAAPNMVWPLAVGNSFDLTIFYEKQKVVQQCVVGSPQSTAKWFAPIGGTATPVICKGSTQYLGMNVNVTSTMIYFDALGIFFHESEDIQTPLGPVQLKRKITDFALTK